MFEGHVFPPNKGEYIKKRRAGITKGDKCILCSVRDGLAEVDNLEVYRRDGFIVSVNLYPYNPGHVIIFPERHVEKLGELEPGERITLVELTVEVMDVLDREYAPQGYNTGMNIGAASGASISHLHAHVVPRYSSELGFMDIVGGAKIYIENPLTTVERLREAFNKGGR